jgi:hypothetical protein
MIADQFPSKLHRNLYAVNFALLAVHEIDSSYWHEWNLFGLPGDIQFFLFVNLILFYIFLIGYHRLITGARSGPLLSFLLAASGIFAFGIHSYFIAAGHPEFTTWASQIILWMILAASALQGIVAIRSYHRRQPSGA